MRSIVTVTTPATSPLRLTTVARVRQELNITDRRSDDLLDSKIVEASSDIAAALGFTVPRETVTETFRSDGPPFADWNIEYVLLDRTPVASIASVTLDGQLVPSNEYELDAKPGILWRLDSAGYRWVWLIYQTLVVAYSGGYLLPGNSGSNLEPSIESATIDLVTEYWESRGRDPSVRAETVFGIEERQYWVGSMGDAGQLPDKVLRKIAPFRRKAM